MIRPRAKPAENGKPPCAALPEDVRYNNESCGVERLGWLLSISPHGSTPAVGLNAASLCALIESVFEWDPADFEILYEIAIAWEPLNEKYKGLIDGILLDSADATQMRNHYLQLLELNSHRPPLLDPPPAERVRMDLD